MSQLPHPPYRSDSRPVTRFTNQPGVRVVVRSILRSTLRSPSNRRRAQDLVWAWVSAKWPRLGVSQTDRERSQFEYSLPGAHLVVNSSSDGSAWSLAVAHSERDGARTWTTRALVAEDGDADVMSLQTSCTDLPFAPLVVAPPRLLGLWVERLRLEDGGLAVLGEPREVSDDDQLDAFCKHVMSERRTLPIIALANSPHSRFYGVDPRGLAEAVRGMAHVAFLAPQASGQVAQRLGLDFGLVYGAARIYAPHFSPNEVRQDHPLLKDPKPVGAARNVDPGAFRRILCRRICAMSVEGTPELRSLS